MIYRLLLSISLLFVFTGAHAGHVQRDTVITDIQPIDTVPSLSLNTIEEEHSPHKATMMAMLLPGAGQVYNKQYWKLPILYGGIGAAIYGLNFNGKYYKKYRKAYIDYTHYIKTKAADPNTPYPEKASWDELYIRGNVESFSEYQQTRFQTLLENKKISYKRDRDLLIIVMAGIYAIQIIDANVFAYFYNFEIDDNLSFNLRPSTSYCPVNGASVGLTLTINLN